MSDIKILIDYLNPRKGKQGKLGKGEFHLIKIDEAFITDNQDFNSENNTKIILQNQPSSLNFIDQFSLISTDYPLFTNNDNGSIKYFFQRNQNGFIDYVSLENLLLPNTNSSHFQPLDDENFQQIQSGIYYYHIQQRAIYVGITVLPEIEIFGNKTLAYNPKELGGLENGTYRVNYQDATGYTYEIFDRFFSSYLEQKKRNIKVTLNPKKGRVYWYPDIESDFKSTTLFYKYTLKDNDSSVHREDYAIKLEFDNIEGFLGFMMVAYFVKGVSPLSLSDDISNRKRDFFVKYVGIINFLLNSSKTNIDQALTYIYYIPAAFFIEEQNLFKKMKDPDNILGSKFIWDLISKAIEDQLTNAGVNKEDIVLRLLKILKFIQKDEKGEKKEKNDYLLNELLDKKTKGNLSYLHALYNKMHTDNFVKYNNFIYSLWRNSSFIDPTNPVFKETSQLADKETDGEIDKNKPRLVLPYKTDKLFGFYSSNINTEFNEKGNVVVTPDESWADNLAKGLVGVGLGEIIEEFTEEDWEAEYHPLQPVYLADPTNDKAFQLQSLSPMLLVKANEDKSFWVNVSTTAEYAFDVITTASGIGNLAKFRHLARAVEVAKAIKKGKKIIWFYQAKRAVTGLTAGVEITVGAVNALLKLTGIKDTKFGIALSEYLFWIELLTLGGQLTVAINTGLRNSAKKLTNDESFKLLDESLDNLVKKGEIDELEKLNVLDELKRIAGEYYDDIKVVRIVPDLKNSAEVKLFKKLRELFFKTYTPLLQGELESTFKLLRVWREFDVLKPLSKSDMENLLSLRARLRGKDSFNNAATMIATVKIKGKLYKLPYTSISGLDETVKHAKFIDTKKFAKDLGLTQRETNDLFRVISGPNKSTVRINDTEHKMLIDFSEDLDKLKVVHGTENIEVIGFEIKSLYAPCHSCKRQIIIYSDLLNIPKEKIKVEAVKIGKTRYAENSEDLDKFLNKK